MYTSTSYIRVVLLADSLQVTEHIKERHRLPCRLHHITVSLMKTLAGIILKYDPTHTPLLL